MTKCIRMLEVGHICLTTTIPLPVKAISEFQSSLFFFQLPNSLYYEGWQVITLMGGFHFCWHNVRSRPSCSHFPHGPRSLLSALSFRPGYRSTTWTFGPVTLSNGPTSWKSTATLGNKQRELMKQWKTHTGCLGKWRLVLKGSLFTWWALLEVLTHMTENSWIPKGLLGKKEM